MLLPSKALQPPPQDATLEIYKNSAVEIGYSHFVNMYNGTSSISANASIFVKLNVTDFVYVTSGRALDVSGAGHNAFSGFLVSPL
jgi:hypothetical protein